MKKLLILITASLFTLSACESDNAPNPTVNGNSKVVSVSYPEIILIGPQFIYIPVGGTYTEQNATLIDDVTGGSSIVGPTMSELDVSTEGMYEIRYEAANGNGFLASASRYVLVLNWTPPAGLDPNYDISGDYLRAATGVITHVIKMDNGLYITSHVGGSTPVPAYMVTPDELSIDIPQQNTIGGLAISSNSEVFSSGPPITFTYRLAASGFGTGTRTFVRQ